MQNPYVNIIRFYMYIQSLNCSQ